MDINARSQPPEEISEAAGRARSIEDVAELLRALRRRHARANRDSSLTYRELAQRTGWSLTAIAEYLTGHTLPRTDRFDALLDVLGATPGELRALADARDRAEENLRKAKARRPSRRSGSGAPAAAGPGSGSRHARARPSTTAPRQLPADSSLFTGRDEELAQLFELAERCAAGGVPGAAVISAVDGMGGVGKTAMVVHAAHRLAEHFPDGQMFVELHGFSPDRPPRDPADALAALLGALGVPPGQIPANTDSRAALYRERLAGTRTLVVLDNAADEAQVGPLLPAALGCLVLVTSRRRLKALDDALPVPLDVLPPQEAITLLRQSARRDPEPSADEGLWEQVAELCGYLPLALVIAGAVLRTGGRAWDLKRLIGRLAPRRAGEELAGYTDEVRSLGAVFDLSYRQLSDGEKLLFRRLGLLPGRVIDAYGAAALLNTDLDTADVLVQRLADHSLLIGDAPSRYRIHDLIQAHANSLAVRLDPAPEREAAQDRLLHYYAHTAQAASSAIARYPRPAPAGPTPAHAPDLAEPDDARAWLRIERPNLDAGFSAASARGLDAHTIALAAGLAELLLADGPWVRAQEIHQAAAEAAERHATADALAAALTDLGHARYLTGDASGAVDAYTRALELHRSLDRRAGEADAMRGLGRALRLTGDLPGALDAHTQALELHRAVGSGLGEAYALTYLGQVRFFAGDYPAAAEIHARALETFRAIGERGNEAVSLNHYAAALAATGQRERAFELYQQALAMNRELDKPDDEAISLEGIAEHHLAEGDTADAALGTAHLRRALSIYRNLGMRADVDRVSARLDGLG